MRGTGAGFAAAAQGRRLVASATLALTISATQCLPPDTGSLTTVDGRCTSWEPLLEVHTPDVGWDVIRMSRIMWRESRCQPDVRSATGDAGLLQINRINHRWLTEQLGEPVTRQWLLDPVNNIRAAAALCGYWERRRTTDCYQPWQVQR